MPGQPFSPNSTGKCPHCGEGVRFEQVSIQTGFKESSAGRASFLQLRTPSEGKTNFEVSACPLCGRAILYLTNEIGKGRNIEVPSKVVWPESSERPVPDEVQDEDPDLAQDFHEAATVLPYSKKASAALSRRCLEGVLVRKAGATGRTLEKKIESVLEKLPSYISPNVDAIRHVGNFAAHPKKSTNTGEIVEVEEGEAEWSLDVLELLFDFYYVQQRDAEAKRAALNKKLEAMGKPPLKSPGDDDEEDAPEDAE